MKATITKTSKSRQKYSLDYIMMNEGVYKYKEFYFITLGDRRYRITTLYLGLGEIAPIYKEAWENKKFEKVNDPITVTIGRDK